MAKKANKGKDKDLTDGGGGQMASIRKQREVYYCLGGKQSSLSAALLIARKTVFFPITILPSEAFEEKGVGEGDEVEDESRDEGGDTK